MSHYIAFVVASLFLLITFGYSKTIVVLPSLNSSYICSRNEMCCLINDCDLQSLAEENVVHILFLSGKHSLSNHLTISNINTVVVRPVANSTVFISQCQYRIMFERISYLTINGVSFVGCSTEMMVCQRKFILCLDVIHLILNNVDFARYGSTNSELLPCKYPLKVALYTISHLTLRDVSFFGYKNAFVFVDIFQVESALIQNVYFLYTDLALIGTTFDILNSRANFLTVETCIEVEKNSSQINIVESVLNETLITMCSSELDCTDNFLSRFNCAKQSFRFNLKLLNTFIQARKDIGCNAISVTVSKHTDAVIDLQGVVCKGNVFADVVDNFNNVNVYVNNSIISERGADCVTGIELTTVRAQGNLIHLMMESLTLAAGVRVRCLSCIDTFKIAIKNTSFFSSSYGLSLFNDKSFMYSEFKLQLIISNSSFLRIRGYAMFLKVPSYRCSVFVDIINTSFLENQGVIFFQRNDGGYYVPIEVYSYIQIDLLQCTLARNGGYKSGSKVVGHILSFISLNKVTLDNCVIANNNNSGLFAFLTHLYLTGRTEFYSNTAVQGGAMSLWYSYLDIKDGAELVISNNRAEDTGGGIHFSNILPSYDRDTSEVRCIVQLNQGYTKFEVRFYNNSARNSGDNIFGARIKTNCTQAETGYMQNVMSQNFKFYSNSLSLVSSDPTRVCLCDKNGFPQCNNIDFIYSFAGTFFPGELFSISLVLVGNDFGTVKGIVSTTLKSLDISASLGMGQNLQIVTNHRKCSMLNFSIESLSVKMTHYLQITGGSQPVSLSRSEVVDAIREYRSASTIPYDLIRQTISINILLEDCPISMVLSHKPPYICTCHPILLDAGIRKCIIVNHTGMVYRSGKTWISAYNKNSNETQFLLAHKLCPYGYCNPNNITVDPKDPDNQCTHYRSGILCGACQEGFSLVLGSKKCSRCSNSFISLLIFFALAGILLVVFLKILSLTVATGTINGLIFYANILWATKSLYSNGDESLTPILNVFLAWLNLDLGIETCFVDGLDAFWKTLLQFVFPIYIWSLTGLIIITSHYSTKASKLFGNNSVPVLATLILLSYSKLLRVIIDSLNFSILTYENGNFIVWTLDGNYHYFGAAHTILFLVVLAVLVLLWVPFTAILLTLQCLKRKSNKKPLRWINKLKPLFDAYFGQLKPKHNYWIGLLLLIRVLLLVVYASTSAIVPTVNIALMVLVAMLLLLIQVYAGIVYKSTYLSVLENSFIVNLVIVGVLTLCLDTIDVLVLDISVSIALIQFVAIMLYHLVLNIKTVYLTRKRRQIDHNVDFIKEERPMQNTDHCHVQYREPLLEN